MFNYPNTQNIWATGVMVVYYLFSFLAANAVAIGAYIFQGISFYTIAKRRGIHHPWLAWVPVGNVWLLGCISDQYQYVVKGRIMNKRKTLLILSILLVVALVLVYVLCGATIFQAMAYDNSVPALDHTAMLNMMGTVLAMTAAALILCGLAVAVSVIEYFAYYDLYSSCDPGKRVLYLLLSIFVSVTLPIFVFICRNKDLGMPPRKPETQMIPEEI